MSSITDKLISLNKISPPNFLKNNVHFEVMMGSVAYGCNTDMSDMDIYGFCIPPKDVIFPHLAGTIHGFGRQIQTFEQFQQHHIKTPEKEYDLSIYNIVKYFQLCMENNPNMIDSLFVPRRCVIHSTSVAEIVRENRKLFLHKGAWHKFKGYAFSQMGKMRNKKINEFIGMCKKYDLDLHITWEYVNDKLLGNEKISTEDFVRLESLVREIDKAGLRTKRIESIALHGFDVKFAYHIVRLLNEVEQIMIEHDLDLERNREQLKSIRRGEWTLEQITQYFEDKEKQLESVYIESGLQHSPDQDKIKELLLNCLEHHFGSLSNCYTPPDLESQTLRMIQEVLDQYNKRKH